MSTAVVELSALRTVTLVKGDDFGADDVVSGLEVGQINGDGTLVGNEVVNSPLAVGETLLKDLGPDGTLTVGFSGGDIDHDGTLVGLRHGGQFMNIFDIFDVTYGSNGFIIITGNRCGVVVMPLEGEGRAGSNLDLVGGGLSVVADHGSGGHISDWVVAVGRSLDSEMLTLVLSIDDEALEGCVSSNEVGSSQYESSGGLHLDCLVVEVFRSERVVSKID